MYISRSRHQLRYLRRQLGGLPVLARGARACPPELQRAVERDQSIRRGDREERMREVV